MLPLQELDEKAKSALGSKGGLPPTTVVAELTVLPLRETSWP